MVYKGQFRFGQFDGTGVLSYPEGGQYEGEFKEGSPNGKGIMRWPTGEKYEGIFKDGEIESVEKSSTRPFRLSHDFLQLGFLISLILNIILFFRLRGRGSSRDKIQDQGPIYPDATNAGTPIDRGHPPSTGGMKMVFTSPNLMACDLLKELLGGERIPCMIKNENSSAMTGYGIPIPNAPALVWAWPEVWVNDEDFEEVSRIVSEFEKTQSIKEEPDQSTPEN